MSKTTPPFSVDKAEESPGLLLWQTTTLWQQKIRETLKPFGVSHSQFVLMAITLWHEVQGQEVTQKTLLDKMTVSGGLKHLVEKKLVSREIHPTDTRVKLVKFTSKGRKLAEKLVPAVEAVDGEFFGRLNRVVKDALCMTLQLLTHEKK